MVVALTLTGVVLDVVAFHAMAACLCRPVAGKFDARQMPPGDTILRSSDPAGGEQDDVVVAVAPSPLSLSASSSASDDDNNNANHPSNALRLHRPPPPPASSSDHATANVTANYHSNLNQHRISVELHPGLTAPRTGVIDVTMKFGSSLLANLECIDRVTRLIRDRMRLPTPEVAANEEEGGPIVPAEVPVRPRAVVCSAMGKTTNALLTTGDLALETGRVNIEVLRTLHLCRCDDFNLPDHTRREVRQLLDKCQDMLNRVRLLQELSP
jgi:hypothetical protein